MRDPERRTRHFIIKKKREDDLDEPSLNRMSDKREGRDSRTDARSYREDWDDSEELREGFFARFSGGKKGPSERDTGRKSRSRRDDDLEYEAFEDEDDDEVRKAPFLVRIFAWAGLLAIFFVCGYLGANYFFNWADKKGGGRVGDVVGSGQEAARMTAAADPANISGNAAYTIFIPEGASFTKREIEIKKGLVEEDIEKVASVYVDSLKETKMLDNGVRILNVFRSGDWVYLDVTDAFRSSLKTLGKDKASAVITGLVMTMRDNFSPAKKIKFYIEGKESAEKIPVDLTKAWEIS